MVADHLWNWQSSGNCNKNHVGLFGWLVGVFVSLCLSTGTFLIFLASGAPPWVSIFNCNS